MRAIFFSLLICIMQWSTASAQTSVASGPGGPILVIGSSANPFSYYSSEVLRAQGFNAFATADISAVTSSVLSKYDVVILGEIALSAGNVTDLTNWTNSGGTLIAFKPATSLYPLLGITQVSGSKAEGYILVNGATGEGKGIVQRTIQFHGTANYVNLNGATSLARLYDNATTSTSYHAITRNNVGVNGGVAYAFMYDLLRSIVYTRQGNPAWAGQKRDGTTGPIRSDDMYYPNWLNSDKVAIPQADEQQHLLSNMIHISSIDRKPMPRFWFLPKGLKAAVVMTGDDHAANGASTVFRFNRYKSQSTDNSPDAVANWNAVRATSYIFPNAMITNDELNQAQNDGFEVGLHLNTGCTNFTSTSWSTDWTNQYTQIKSLLPSMLNQVTHRTHCIAWSDFSTQPKKEASLGVRLDVNYYYWPENWVLNKPGLFTGSGMPMRFSDVDGTLIDCYQVITQMTDESGMDLGLHIRSLLDSALGPSGYYGVFCANMHTDNVQSQALPGSDIIVAEALKRNVPVVSARQMLEWIDGRNGSTFKNITWSGDTLRFNITAATGSRNMKAMLPLNSSNKTLSAILYNGSVLDSYLEVIKGIPYVFFDATKGIATYEAVYVAPTSSMITDVKAVSTSSSTAVITWNTNIFSDSRVVFGTSKSNLSATEFSEGLVKAHQVTLKNLSPGTVYYYRVYSYDNLNTSLTNPVLSVDPLGFMTPSAACSNLDSSFVLDGSRSAGSISKYEWTLVSGPNTPVIKNPASAVTNVIGAVNGTYVFRLSLNGNAQQSLVLVNVNPPVSSAFVHAGYDRQVILPVSSVNLDGNGCTGPIRSYAWSKVSGPGTVTITNGTSRNAQAGGLSAGDYIFELMVRDSNNVTYRDSVSIKVSPSPLPGTPVIAKFNAASGNRNTVLNTLSGVSSGSLLVLTLAQADDLNSGLNPTISSTPSLTWSKRVGSSGPLSGNAAIWTAYYPAGGNISVTSVWGVEQMSCALYALTNYDSSLAGASAVAGNQSAPSVSINTTQPNSLIIGVTSDWNAMDGASRSYRGSSSESFYEFKTGIYGAYHYQLGSTDVASYTLGLASPSGMSAGTALWEVTGKPVVPSASVADAGNNQTIYLAVSPSGNAVQTFCGTATIDLLRANGTGIKWYASATSVDVLPTQQALFNGTSYFASQVVSGCEPSVRFEVKAIIDVPRRDTASISVCSNKLPYLWHGKLYSTGGTYTDTLRNYISGCDTLLTLRLSVIQLRIDTTSVQICSEKVPYIWYGKSYGSTGKYYDTIAGMPGQCDSIRMLDLTVLPSASKPTIDSVRKCDGTYLLSVSSAGTKYLWSTGDTIAAISVANAGTYSVTVKNTSGCSASATIELYTVEKTFSADISEKQDVRCFGESTGSFRVAVRGGQSPFLYSLDNIVYDTLKEYASLQAGKYKVYIKDAFNCLTTATADIFQPSSSLALNVTKTNVEVHGAETGSINMKAFGGVGNYKYKLNEGSFVDSGCFPRLATGYYKATASDANGCNTSKMVFIDQPTDDLSCLQNTWAGEISTAWEDPLNWTCGMVPTSNSDVSIPANTVFKPTISSHVVIKSLWMKSSSLLTINDGFSLKVKSEAPFQ